MKTNPQTAAIVDVLEKTASAILKNRGMIDAIVFLRECAGGPRVQEFLIEKGATYHSFNNGSPALSLVFARDWVYAISKGESIFSWNTLTEVPAEEEI